MSIVIMIHGEDHATLVTDTLSSFRPEEPAGFVTKVWTQPHLNMMFAMQGAGMFGFMWDHFISTTWTCRDIETVNEVAADELRSIRKLLDDQGHERATARFFHYGFPTGSDKVVHYRYLDESDYEPERLDGPGFTVVPWAVTFDAEPPATLEDVIDLATRVRDENDRRLVADPIGIGGELYATTIRNWSVQTQRLHRFSDYDDTWQQIVRNNQHEGPR